MSRRTEPGTGPGSERWRRFEHRVRPFAAYCLVCSPVLTIHSIVYDVRLQLGAQPMSPIAFALVVAWSVTVFAALVVTAAAGVVSLSYDPEVTPERRASWGVAFVFTAFVASALFVVLRWRRERAVRLDGA